MMVPTQVFLRTFHIAWGNFTGTAFAIDRDGKQYLVTARHVVKGIESGDTIKISNKQKWHEIAVNVVGIGNVPIRLRQAALPAIVYRRPVPCR